MRICIKLAVCIVVSFCLLASTISAASAAEEGVDSPQMVEDSGVPLADQSAIIDGTPSAEAFKSLAMGDEFDKGTQVEAPVVRFDPFDSMDPGVVGRRLEEVAGRPPSLDDLGSGLRIRFASGDVAPVEVLPLEAELASLVSNAGIALRLEPADVGNPFEDQSLEPAEKQPSGEEGENAKNADAVQPDLGRSGPRDLSRGESEDFTLEFDVASFADLVTDPSALEFTANIDCSTPVECASVTELDSALNAEQDALLVSIPAGLITASPRRAEFSEGPVIVAQQTSSGESGDYSASRLTALSEWQVGVQSGHAELTYPFDFPIGPGHVPDLDLSYSSGLVDSLSDISNGQVSRLGAGWSEPVSVITRDTSRCEGADALCASFGRNDGFRINFSGVSAPLVRTTTRDEGLRHPDYPSESGVRMWEYVTQFRNDWLIRRVEQESGDKSNGDRWNTWWEVTTGDGELHIFGREYVLDYSSEFSPTGTPDYPLEGAPDEVHWWHRSGSASGPSLGSAQVIPLGFGDVDECGTSSCDAAVAWHLDQVLDSSGNLAVYTYDSFINNIVSDGQLIDYEREIRLASIDWGLRFDQSTTRGDYATPVPFRAVLDYDSSRVSDVPDFECGDAGSPGCQPIPTFYATSILTELNVLVSGQRRQWWSFDHRWVEPAANYPSERAEYASREAGADTLWLEAITWHGVGANGGETTSAVTSYEATWLANRVNPGSNGFMYRPRIATLVNPSGGRVGFSYGQSSPPSEDPDDVCLRDAVGNAVRRPCDMYPTGVDDGALWFNKWKVLQMIADPVSPSSAGSDGDAAAVPVVTSYQYLTPPDWAWGAIRPTFGYWNDYRGHRLVRVYEGTQSDNAGFADHFYYTGMANDRYGYDDPRPLAQVEPNEVPAVVEDPRGQRVPNERPLSGRFLGSKQMSPDHPQGLNLMTYEVETSGDHEVAFTDGPALFARWYEVGSTTSETEIYDNPESGVPSAVTKGTRSFDELGRVTVELDYGLVADNDNPNAYLEDDDLRREYHYLDLGRSWFVDQPYTSVLRVGTGPDGVIISGEEINLDARGRVSRVGQFKNPTKSGAENDSGQDAQTMEYDSRGLLVKTTRLGDSASEADDQTLSYEYNTTYGTLTSVTRDLSGVVYYDMDPVFRSPLNQIDQNGNETAYAYDGFGRLLNVRLPGATEDSYRFTYDINRDGIDVVKSEELRKTWGDDRYSVTWAYYDGLGRQVQSQARHQWDDGLTNVASTRYDGRGRVLETVEPQYRQTTPGTYFAHDWSNPGDSHVVYSYPNELGDEFSGAPCRSGENTIMSFRGGQSNEWARSASVSCGRLSASWDRDGKLSQAVSDVRGKVTSQTATDGGQTTFEYNIRGDLVRMEDPIGATTEYIFEDWKLYGPDRVVDSDRGTSSVKFDDFGRIARLVDGRGVELAYGYDQENRPTNLWEVGADGKWRDVSRWDYDWSGSKGLLGRATQWNRQPGSDETSQVEQRFFYDHRSRVDLVEYEIDGLNDTQTTAYTYYEDDQVRTVTYPNGVVTTTDYSRQGQAYWMGLDDPDDDLDTRTAVLGVTYTARGQVEVLKRGVDNAPWSANSYYRYQPDTGRLHSVYTDTLDPAGDRRLGQYFEYDYSDEGLVWSIAETVPGSTTKVCHWYDEANRLTRSWSQASGDRDWSCSSDTSTDGLGPEPFEVAYTYDRSGRITSAEGVGTVDGAYGYSGEVAHAPSEAGAVSFAYDGAGNRTERSDAAGSVSYSYDVSSRLSGVSGSTSTQMAYDANGERVSRSVGGLTTFYLPSGYEVTSEGDSTVNLSIAGRLVGVYKAETDRLWSVSTDHLGTPSLTVGGSQDLQYRRYTPFGQPRSDSSEPGDVSDLTFTGQRDDPSTGLMYYGARYYDPEVGQFCQPDPLTADGMNRYAYVANNPVSFVDPTGLFLKGAWEKTKSAGKAVGNFVKENAVEIGVGIAVGAGCAAAIGLGSMAFGVGAVAGAVACGALAGAAGRATSNVVHGRSLGDGLLGATVTGGLFATMPGVGKGLGKLGSKAFSVVARTAPKTSSAVSSLTRSTVNTLKKPVGTVLSSAKSAGSSIKSKTKSALSSTSKRSQSGQARNSVPDIKPGSAGGPTAGQRFSQGVRSEALEENPSTCVYCHLETDKAQVDHAIPRSRGGNATIDNAQSTCPHCNASKRDRDFPVNPPPDYRGPWPPPWWSGQ